MEDKVIKLSNSRVSPVPGRESAKLLGNAVGLKAESEYQRPLRLLVRTNNGRGFSLVELQIGVSDFRTLAEVMMKADGMHGRAALSVALAHHLRVSPTPSST